jgi:ribonuclease Z
MDKILIAAGKSALGRINDLIFGVVLKGNYPPVEITLQPLETGLLFDEGDFTVSTFPVYHRTPDCYGFLFQEISRRPFLTEKAEDLQIPPGPWRGELVRGQEVTLPDGRVINPEDVLGEEHPGTKLVHVGDSGRTDNLLDIARGADALVIEATYLESEKELAEQFGHLTARQTGELAREAGVGTLILTHISRRYRTEQVLEEARSVFPQVFVARDFDRFQIKRGEVLKL